MVKYDVEKARQSAIQSIKAKQHRLLSSVNHKFSDPTSSNGLMHPLLEQTFNDYCIDIRIGTYSQQGCTRYIENNPRSMFASAVAYVKLEKLVKRLENGEDPRIILFEIVSNEV